MSDYSKSTNFTTKDTLPTGNANKIVKGTELDIEFTNIASAISSKANTSSPNLLGTPTAPTATAGTNTTQIATCSFVLVNGFPSGGIVMWSGSIASIPSGWYLCNGSNGTPDLRNKFIIGADADEFSLAKTSITGSATQTGGSKDSIVVAHTHTATDHSHTGVARVSQLDPKRYLLTGYSGVGANEGMGTADTTSQTTDTAAVTIASTGTSGTNANLPPYYALAFIMKS